ncbi:Heavy metal transport/detoxification protein [Magnetococcus marinus MC-1]|uniref:Heavy metal transport/detoxification protein n=1 Tax=Magnetococcus marinus (strain ATCC BAA-1437 / JCM 17883 / MC-1) TaxID=156889 RepID=A0L9F5_MAGMM|nr:heavy-metal-associated domain-containing protein [Magnetococcus marinus]ABK44598.1 Heavy metal transport/detoxification protein [Magnetococcus marinus MC-1]
MAQLTLAVAGMTCQHCVKAVTQVAMGVDGVVDCDIDLQAATVTLTLAADADTANVGERAASAIRAEGYPVEA